MRHKTLEAKGPWKERDALWSAASELANLLSWLSQAEKVLALRLTDISFVG